MRKAEPMRILVAFGAKIPVRTVLRSRAFGICLQGELRWPRGNPREVDAAVRIGDRLLLIECFSYELPLDYEVGKPIVYNSQGGNLAS